MSRRAISRFCWRLRVCWQVTRVGRYMHKLDVRRQLVDGLAAWSGAANEALLQVALVEDDRPFLRAVGSKRVVARREPGRDGARGHSRCGCLVPDTLRARRRGRLWRIES